MYKHDIKETTFMYWNYTPQDYRLGTWVRC